MPTVMGPCSPKARPKLDAPPAQEMLLSTVVRLNPTYFMYRLHWQLRASQSTLMPKAKMKVQQRPKSSVLVFSTRYHAVAAPDVNRA